jgi:hypothetical protein
MNDKYHCVTDCYDTSKFSPCSVQQVAKMSYTKAKHTSQNQTIKTLQISHQKCTSTHFRIGYIITANYYARHNKLKTPLVKTKPAAVAAHIQLTHS